MRWIVPLGCMLAAGCAANDETLELRRLRKENLRLQQELKSTKDQFITYAATQEALARNTTETNKTLKSLVELSKKRIDQLERRLEACRKEEPAR